MNKIKNFFIWCSGASVEITNKCDDKEKTKYTNIGIVVFAVALLSSLSSTYFLSFAFNTITTAFTWVYFPVGIIWSLIILSLNRAFVSTINKNDGLFKQILKAIPIFFLTITIGIIVATPIEFKIFEKEINQIVYDEAKEIVKENIEENFDKEIIYWNTKIEDAETSYLDYKQMYEDEVEGRKSGIPGKGTRATEYMNNELKAKQQLDIYKDSLNSLNERIIEYYDSFDIDEEIKIYVAENVGVLKRVEILYDMGNIHTILTFLFILIETLPVLIKLMSPRGSYDDITLNEHTLYIEQAKSGLNNSLLTLNQDTIINEKKLEYELKAIEDQYNKDHTFNEREFQNKMDKAEIDFNNDLKIHNLRSTHEREQIEEDIKNTKPRIKRKVANNDDNSILEKYWRLKDTETVYYFDINKTKKSLQKPFYLFEDGKMTNGTWHFKIDGDLKYIIISINGDKITYLINDMSSDQLILELNNEKFIFVKTEYI